MRRCRIGAIVAIVAAAMLPAAIAQAQQARVLDDFADATAWRAIASDQVASSLRRDADGSLCLDYDFGGVSGYAVMRRDLKVDWPADFDLVARIKGRGAVNHLQVKLVDASGDNVWWLNRPDEVLPATPTDLRMRRRQIDFAWGPATDRTLRSTEAIEFTIAAGRDGGSGALCLSRLTLRERDPAPAVWPDPVVTQTPSTTDVDFGATREFNGVALRWPDRRSGPLGYELLASDDGRHWRSLRTVRDSDGGIDAVFVPDSEARWLRVRHDPGPARPTVDLRDARRWPDRNAVIAELAAAAPRGDLPRAFIGQQNYWTLVGVDGGGERSALIGEDGAIEVGRGGYSVAPAVIVDGGAPVTWSGVELSQSLRDGDLPLPSVHWRHPDFALTIAAAADGPRKSPSALARYTLRNTGSAAHVYTLVLAVRPWQVNPPQQFLATPGGASPVERLSWDGRTLAVDGRPLRPTATPDRVTALPWDGGLTLAGLVAAPPLATLDDAQRHASAALQFRLTLAPGETATVGWIAPLTGPRSPPAEPPAADESTPQALAARFDAVAAGWRQRLSRLELQVPPGSRRLVETLRIALAHILISRDGPALMPGTRAYARSWIRDGAMMVAALVRLGETDAARAFVDWYAARIFASGKVPCCVDSRGADPVTENDSHGEYLHAVAEVWRHTGDRSWLAGHWPQVQRVVAWQESLRQGERGSANTTPDRAHLFGLLPPSISHEGYSDKPAYAYWDDFWALRGYKDAVVIAQALGHGDDARRWSGWRDEFGRELSASIAATAVRHGMSVIAGAADRGDFDPTSTTIALDPAQADVPRDLLAATFDRYWQQSLARAEGRSTSTGYTPYELRNVGALVRLGHRERALAMLRFFLADQRPAAWRQWAEVVVPDVREPRFLGDMPHAWVSSDYIRSALDLFAYRRESGGTIVIGAGFTADWLVHPLVVNGLSTASGRLDFSLRPQPGGWRLELPRAIAAPLRLSWPAGSPPPEARHGDRRLAWDGNELPLPAPPATIDLVDHR